VIVLVGEDRGDRQSGVRADAPLESASSTLRAVDHGQFDLTRLGGLIARDHASVKVCLERMNAGWELRHAEAVVGATLPTTTAERWEYQAFVFAAVAMPATVLASWFQTAGANSASIGGLTTVIPATSPQASCRRYPSLAAHGRSLPWPTCDYEIYRAAGNAPPQTPVGFLVGDDCPSFPSFETAFRAFFAGDFSMTAPASLPSELGYYSRMPGSGGSKSAPRGST